ncbi:MAG: hypothetical protein WCB92_09465 [Mycobacterium sp.]
MSERTRPSSQVIRRGRLKKATQFLDAALLIDEEMSDASVTLLVNAGIAAADVTATSGEQKKSRRAAEALVEAARRNAGS